MLYLFFFSVNPCLIDRFYHTFVLTMLYGCIIIYNYKTEGKKERKKKERKKELNATACHRDSTLKGALYFIYPKKFNGCTLRYILVLRY